MPETTNGTQAIDRAAQLLVRVVEAAQPPSVGELAERAGLPKSTTSRLVSALERQGLVQRLGDRGRLRPGPVLLRFAGRETVATKIFGRLSAWQNWIFIRPNAVGEKGALKVYGKGDKAQFDLNRV